jgi:hypothetical protein
MNLSTETRTLRRGDRVLVTPSPLTHNRWHRAMQPDQPGTTWQEVDYVASAGPDLPSWLDVVFTSGGYCSVPATALWTVEA